MTLMERVLYSHFVIFILRAFEHIVNSVPCGCGCVEGFVRKYLLATGWDDAEAGVGRFVEGGRIHTADGFGFAVASEDGLVENAAAAACEGELGGVNDLTKIVFFGPANVEEMAAVVNISVKTEKKSHIKSFLL